MINLKHTRYTHCAVPQCTSWGKTHPDLSFHVLPDPGKQHIKQQTFGRTTFECRRSLWISKLKIEEPITKNMRVCSRHFLESDYFFNHKLDGITDSRRRLKSSAVPSQNLPGSSAEPVAATPNNLVFVVVPNELIPAYAELGQMQQLQCPQCSYTSEWNFQLQHHFRREHQTVYDLEFNAVFELELYKCPVCFFTDDCKLSTCQHSNHNHCCSVYRCKLCDFTTFSSLKLMTHRKSCKRRVHKKCAETDVTAAQFQCEECSYRSSDRVSFDRHVKRHQEQLFDKHLAAAVIAWKSCTQCSYRCTDTYSLKRHMLRHADAKDIAWHECDVCVDVRFKFKSDLKKHKRFKHGPRDQVPCFRCPECQYSSVRKNDLSKHMVTHAERGPKVKFSCPHVPCAFRTKRPKVLVNHVLLHSQISRQQCVDGSAAAASASGGDSIATYKCDQCSFVSNEKKMLMKHVQVHNVPENTPKWLKCQQPGCSYMCIAELQNSFNRHMLKHLADKNEDQKWLKCEQPGCSYMCTVDMQNSFDRHMLKHVADKNAK